MAFIQVEFGGRKSTGGYLKIDGGKQTKLADGMIIPIEAGTHYLSFSNKSGSTHAMARASAATGNYNTAYMLESDSVDGDITVNLDENDMMFLTVVSDNSGNVLALPTYSVRELDEEEIERAYELLSNQNDRAAARSRKRKLIWGIILAFLGVDMLFTPGGLPAGLILTAVGAILILFGIKKKKK